MTTKLLHGFYLGDLLVEPLTGQITGPDVSEHLAPKAADVLLQLALGAGDVISHDKLLAAVWGEGKGSHDALSRAVSAIRHALRDHADDPKFVQTLPRRGYRLIVNPVPVSIDVGQANGQPPADAGTTRVSFFENLKERGVIETAVAYSLFGWLIIQVADIVFDQLLLPQWAGTFITALVLAGFPIAIVLAWFLELRDGRAVVHKLSPKDSLRRRLSRTYVSVVGALAIAAAVVYVYDTSIGLPQAPAPAAFAGVETVRLPVEANSIAVLPFRTIDSGGDTQIFANGLADDVIASLSRVPALLVSSRGDSFTLDPLSASQRVRERLRVALYVAGSIQIDGEQMRVAVQLIDSATGFTVLSRKFDRVRQDFFSMRDEITGLIVANVRVALPPDTRISSSLVSDHPSLDAYVLYRRGVDASRLPRTIDNIKRALGWFDEALAIDTDYAGAHAGKCEVYVSAYPVTDDPEFIKSAQASCARALELNPNLDVVHAALGELYRATGQYADAKAMYLRALQDDARSVVSLIGLGTIETLQNKPAAAEKWFRQAIGLHPGDWSAYNALGFFLYRSGRYAEAAELYQYVVTLDNTNMVGYTNLGTAHMLAGNFEAAAAALLKANEIEPRSATYSSLGLMFYYQGQRDEAIEAHRHAVKLAPQDHLAWSNLGDALWIADEPDDAKNAFETAGGLVAAALEVNANDPAPIMDLAWISSMLGDNTRARSLIKKARNLSPDDPYVHYIDGLILLRNGDKDGAISALQIAAKKGYSTILLAADPQLTQLHSHPRFESVINIGSLSGK